MELTPVYEGESGVAAEGSTVVLGTNAIQLIHLETSEVTEAPLVRSLRLSGTIDDCPQPRGAFLMRGTVQMVEIGLMGHEQQRHQGAR